MSKQYTTEEIIGMQLVGYERTKSEAKELARDHFMETGQRCAVMNCLGTRARRGKADAPWQVRVLRDKAKETRTCQTGNAS